MAPPSRSTRENRTTGRSISISTRALRAWFALESRFAPKSAEQRAARLFVTPPQHKRNTIYFSAESPLVDDVLIVARARELHDANRRIATWALGRGPTVMLLHGWGGSARDMAPLAGTLARAGYRAVLFDMPGHGRSSGRESSLVDFLSATRTVADTLGAPDLIIGHSLGGAAAVFALTELALPASAAVLIAPAPGPAYFADRFARAIGLPPKRADGMLRHVVERVGRSVESLDALVAARDVSVPALILHDPEDREVPWRYATAMADAWQGSRLVPTRSLGHKRVLRDAATLASVVDFGRAVVAPRTLHRSA